MKRLWSFVDNEDDPFGPGIDLIISLVALLLVILVITAKSYQDINIKHQQSLASLNYWEKKAGELDGLFKKEEAKNSELEKRLQQITRDYTSKKLQFPPNIIITAAEGYDFPSGSAELTDALKTFVRKDLVGKIEKNIQEFDIDTVVIIGHTDGESVDNSASNLDSLVESVAVGSKSVKELRPGSNADLGLMRALAVVKELQDIQKKEGRFKGLDPQKGFRAYSAGQLTLKNGEFAQPNPNPDKQRRRIEIRFTKSGGG